MLPRLIGPREQLERDNDESLGFIPPAHLDRRTERTLKQDGDPLRNQLIVVSETLWFTRANIAENATTTLLTPFPTSSTAFGANSRSHYIPAPARLVVVRLSANDDVTAETMTPNILITEGSDTETISCDEAALDTTYVNSKAMAFDWDVAPQMAAGATIAVRVVTPVGFLPVSIDVTVSVTLGYSRWIS